MPSTKQTTTTPDRLLYPIEEARQILGGICRTTIYAMVKDGQLHLTKIGKRSFVSDAEMKRIAGQN